MSHRDCDAPHSDLPPCELEDSGREKMPPWLYRPGSRPLRAAGSMISVCLYVETRSCISVQRSFARLCPCSSVGLPTVGHCFPLLWRI
jgi:hypothetical protein